MFRDFFVILCIKTSFTIKLTKTVVGGIQADKMTMGTLIMLGLAFYLVFCIGGGILSDGRKKRRW